MPLPLTTALPSFTLTTEQYAELAGLNDFCRRHEIDVLLYAHVYRERCRQGRVAILNHWADRALQDEWQAERETLIAAVDGVFFGAEQVRAAA